MPNGEELRQKLCEPFPSSDVDWRVSKISDQSGLAVPYIDSRAIQTRLDDTVGPFRWRTRFIPWHQYVPKPGKYDKPEETTNVPVSSQLCALAIYDEERKEWVEKVDGAENTEFETIKGGISDSFKRAAVLWGVGRYLYDIGAKWSPISEKKMITDKGKAELTAYYTARLQKLGLCHASTQTSETQKSVYRVLEINPAPVQGSPNAVWVQLVTPDNRRLQAFYRGAKPGLAGGILIHDTRFVEKQSAAGAYCELQDYAPVA